jgi:serine-aspartate repeat-containing protein C/D/E
MGDLGLNVSDDAAVSLATKIEAANSSGNDVSITSDGNTVAIIDATENTQTTVDANTGTTTVVDENTNTTTQTAVDADTKTQTSVVVDANNNTTTQTIVNDQTNVTTSITVNLNTDITTQTKTDPNTNTQTTVVTDTNTNTQTTIKVNTSNGDVISKKETTIPDVWKPPVVTPPVVPPVPKPPTVTPPKAPAAPAPAAPKVTPKPSDGVIAGAGMIGLPLGINVDPASLRSQVTGGAIDPLARVKAAQAELEREVMMNQMDPRFLAAIQQRMDPQQQTKQFDDDIGALSKLLRGEPEAPANEGQYYSYGSEDSIDNILGGKAANYKEGGFVEPLKASGGMVLPLLAKSGGALGNYKGREDFKNGKHVAGEGDGQSDDIPAWLADGEFVFPADVVSALGNGSTKAGTDKLYEMMHGIRDRARSNGPKDLPPPALKSPLNYLKSSKRSTS